MSAEITQSLQARCQKCLKAEPQTHVRCDIIVASEPQDDTVLIAEGTREISILQIYRLRRFFTSWLALEESGWLS